MSGLKKSLVFDLWILNREPVTSKEERKRQMKECLETWVLVLVTAVFGLFATNASGFELITKTETVVVDNMNINVIRTADNFIVLFDSSSSMGEPYKDTGKKKVEVEKAVLKDRNAKLPPLGFNAGLYTFTPRAGSFTLKALKPYYEMKPYNKAEFAAAIDQLPDKASGPTLLQEGLYELGKILSGLKGRTVVFVFTDGKFSKSESMLKPKDIAQELAKKYNVCFYVISNAPSQMEQQVLKAVASINECSRVIAFDDLVERPEYTTGALFIIQAGLVQKVVDIEKVIGAKMDDILFDFNKSDIGPDYIRSLEALGKFMRNNPQTYTVLAGFTDSIGDQEYNLHLSRLRAEAVGLYLAEKFDVDPHRIVLEWYGEAGPVAGNDTEEGQRLNRRVEVLVAEMP
jgi:OOP family OmpA-OmpF porin